MSEEPVVRAVLGSVTHADGTTTVGLHFRNAAGELVLSDLTEETIDWARWQWATRQAARVLRGETLEEYRG